ncbi:unnamed protein product [Fusarium equiseti]|uniref:Arrestin-like N-terminal domain-containing protein n=1 Tax=Fusarium equiseti TaxID=61235 RepID=A0A8J2INH1_FUSEQ|nr:unnamed protein product [Fusarium equiseti]
MPRTVPQCSPALGIRLEGNQPSYAPGDIIIGHVYRKIHAVSPSASIQIKLGGRTKTKLIVSSASGGNKRTTYRGRFNLIPENIHWKQIFEGPLHIEQGGDEQVWPFAITLPKYVDPKYLENGEQHESFLPLGATDCVLPSTYSYPTAGTTEAFVEYYLTATLRMRGKSASDGASAVLPITVANLENGPPIADFAVKQARSSQTIYTYRLVPTMKEVKLSFSQKFKQVLQTTSVPTFVFNMFVGLPTIIQLDNPNPIPFKLHIVPDLKATSEALRDVKHQVRLTYVSIRIFTLTEVICEGTFAPHTKDKTNEYDLCVMGPLSHGIREGIYIPCTDGESAIDIGEMINLRLGHFSRGFPQLPGDLGLSFDPTFTTYNIRQSHRLKWEVKGIVAEEEFKEYGTVPITLLAPSDEYGMGGFDQSHAGPIPAAGGSVAGPSQIQRNESWIQPPAEDEAPPSFNQAVKEDTPRPAEKAAV